MICTTRTVTVGNTTSSVDSPIVLYKGDRGINITFEINNKFKFIDENMIESTKASFGQLVIKNGKDVSIISEISPCKDGKVSLVITEDMTDEIREIGIYQFQIRLYDSTQSSRITLPPVLEGIEIRTPIAEN